MLDPRRFFVNVHRMFSDKKMHAEDVTCAAQTDSVLLIVNKAEHKLSLQCVYFDQRTLR